MYARLHDFSRLSEFVDLVTRDVGMVPACDTKFDFTCLSG